MSPINVPPNVGIALPVPQVPLAPKPAADPDWEAGLVRQCQGGDEEAFRLLVERYQRKVFSIVYRLVRRRADVEDIAQQVFTKVYFGLRHFDFRCALITWIYKITINECYDYLRKQRVQNVLCVSEITEEQARRLHNNPAVQLSPERQAEMAQMVSRLLAKVSPEERLLLLMKEVEGYSVQDLARMLAWNENTVKVRLFRARKRLLQIAEKQLRRRK